MKAKNKTTVQVFFSFSNDGNGPNRSHFGMDLNIFSQISRKLDFFWIYSFHRRLQQYYYLHFTPIPVKFKDAVLLKKSPNPIILNPTECLSTCKGKKEVPQFFRDLMLINKSYNLTG